MAPGSGNELVDAVDSGVAPDRQRLFIARQACENCRQKKSRCDGDNPCGACRNTGVACVFSGRKATKNEVSLGMIFNTLQRIERKVERQNTAPSIVNAPSPSERSRAGRSRSRDILTPTPKIDEDESPGSRRGTSVRGTSNPNTHDAPSIPPVALASHAPVIPYPIRQIATWPAIRPFLAGISRDGQNHAAYSAYHATLMEKNRSALPPTTILTAEDLASRLSLSLVKDLCDKFFATFNLANPILDRKLFGQHTTGVAVNSEFGPNIESCLVLVVMALGSLGKAALREGGFGAMFGLDAEPIPPSGYRESEDGLIFFNEARRRAGFINCDNSLQSCQFYLLSGLFYSQLLRPVDWWAMVNRASVCCTSFWACPPEDCDEWMMDMQSRLFWNTAMFEDVLTQELDLPVSNLRQYGDCVPLPRFVEFPGVLSFASPATTSNHDEEREALCHYHFLSQIAHRIILTRLRDSIFASARAGSGPAGEVAAVARSRYEYPPLVVEAEMLHQLEQWRAQLPEALQWDDEELVPAPTSPENILVVPWLRSRYWIARYHLRRPLLHRALHYPDSMTTDDFEKCNDAISSVMKWLAVTRVTLTMGSCFPLKSFFCSQLFGLALLFHAFGRSPVPELRRLVPEEYDSWCRFCLQYLEECAPSSPTVSKEYEIVASLLRGQ